MKPKRKTTIIERVEILDLESVRAVTLQRLKDQGFSVIRCGPFLNRESGQVRLDWFMLTAERVVK